MIWTIICLIVLELGPTLLALEFRPSSLRVERRHMVPRLPYLSVMWIFILPAWFIFNYVIKVGLVWGGVYLLAGGSFDNGSITASDAERWLLPYVTDLGSFIIAFIVLGSRAALEFSFTRLVQARLQTMGHSPVHGYWLLVPVLNIAFILYIHIFRGPNERGAKN